MRYFKLNEVARISIWALREDGCEKILAADVDIKYNEYVEFKECNKADISLLELVDNGTAVEITKDEAFLEMI